MTDKMRERFEAWYSDAGEWPKAVERKPDGQYTLVAAVSAWRAWQSAYAAGAADERERCAAIESAIKKLHAAKGRYHTQIAACEMYDLMGLPNVRPGK